MVDTCTITRSIAEERDEGFDESTGDYTGSGTGTNTIYGPDICAVHQQAEQDQTIAGGPMAVKLFRVSLPFRAPEIKIGDDVTMNTSLDPLLEGVVLHVREVRWASLQVTRRLVCTRRVDARNLD